MAPSLSLLPRFPQAPAPAAAPTETPHCSLAALDGKVKVAFIALCVLIGILFFALIFFACCAICAKKKKAKSSGGRKR